MREGTGGYFLPVLSLLFFSSVAYGGETPLPTFLIRFSVFALILLLLCFRPRFPQGGTPLDLSVLLFIFYSLVSSSWAVYPWAAYQFTLNILCIGLAYFLLRCVGLEGDGSKESNRVMAVVLLAATAQAGYELHQYISGQPGRPGGFFANPNFLADYLFFGFVVALHFGSKETGSGRPARKVLFFALAALMAYGISLTRSRAMVAVAVGVLLFLAPAFRGGKKWVVLVGAAGGVALFLAAIASRISTAADPYAFSRLNMWKAAWKTAVAHPIGVGLGGYKFFWLRFRDPILSAPFHYGKTADTAHSQFFGILSELGFPGVALAVAVAGFLLLLIWRESRREDRILPLCLIPLGSIVHAFFDVNLDVLAIALPVAVCAALLANRNTRGKGENLTLPFVLRTGLALILLLCIGYSAASCLGFTRYLKGVESLKGGNTKQAMHDISSAMRFDPLSSAYPDAVSSIYYRWYLQTSRVEYLAAAVNAEQEAAAASPEDPLRLSQVGFLLGEMAEAVQGEDLRSRYRGFALSALKESLRRDPYSTIALLRMAEIHRRAGDSRLARAVLERAIALEPNAGRVYLLLAGLEEGEDPAQAAMHYRKAIALSLQYEDKPLESWQRDLVRIDRGEVERRIETLEKGHFRPNTGGQ